MFGDHQNGDTALHHAAREGKDAIVHILLKDYCADAFCKNKVHYVYLFNRDRANDFIFKNGLSPASLASNDANEINFFKGATYLF